MRAAAVLLDDVRRPTMLLGIVLALAAPCAAVATDSQPAAAPAAVATTGVPPALDAFFHYGRTPAYDSLKLQVQVPMRDGKHLACYLYKPAVKGTTKPAPGRFPGIIDNFTPYYLAYPASHFQGGYFAARGYVDLECTPRGVGKSEGLFDGWLSEVENLDNYDMIEWLAHRSDSTGRIAQEGDSYGGMTAYRVASLRPPHLVTIAPQQSYASLYLEYAYPGGIRSLGDPDWYAFTAAVGAARPAVSMQQKRWLQHSRLDAYWRQIDIDTKWPRIDLPILGFGSWRDLFQDGMVRNYLALAGPNTYLIDGPWTHGSTFDDTVWFGAMLAWFDRWLYGDTAAPLPPTHVASYQMPAGPWHTLADWSASSSTAETLSLASTGKLSATPGAPGTASYVVNPAAGAVDLPAADHLTFTGAPLTSTRAIRGAGSVQLDAMLTDPAHRLDGRRADTNFVLHLYDVDTSGSKTLITRGYLKASHYRSQSDPEAIPLGSSIRYTIPLWHIDYRVGAGHHVELVLQAGEKDCCQSSAPAAAQPVLPVTVSVATGSGGSTLRVPWTDSAVG